MAMRLRRRKSKSTKGTNVNRQEQKTPPNNTIPPNAQCNRHHSCDSHGSAETGSSSVDSMVYLDAYDWRTTPMHSQARVGRSIAKSQPKPEPAACDSKRTFAEDGTFGHYYLCGSPVAPSCTDESTPLRPTRDTSSVAQWSTDGNMSSGCGFKTTVHVFDDITSTRTSYLTDSMLVLVPDEL